MCALCSVYCVESTKQAQRLQTHLCLHDINATMMSKKWNGSYDSGPKYRGEWRWLSHGCRKVSMDQYANCGTVVPKVCNLTVTYNEKSEKNQS